MQTAVRAMILVVLVGSRLTAQQIVISANGETFGGVDIDGQAVGWSMDRPYRNVTIRAHLLNGLSTARGIAYLMHRVGPGTTSASEVASGEFELPREYDGPYPLFSNLNLPAGDYWLVLSGRAIWVVSNPGTLTTANGARFLGATILPPAYMAEYVPASPFALAPAGTYSYQFDVSREPLTVDDKRRCRPEGLNLPLTVADHERWGKGDVRGDAESAIVGYGCGGVAFADFASAAEDVGRARVKVTFHYVLENDSDADKRVQLQIAIVLPDREIKAGIGRGLRAGEGQTTPSEVNLLVPWSELRLGPPPRARITMVVE